MSHSSERDRILLILPCTKRKPYSSSPTWRFIIDHIGPELDHIELAAIDCITNPITGKPFGIVPMSEEHMVVGLDETPDPEKLGSLVEAVRIRLTSIRSRFRVIVAYINVRAYWHALEEVADEFGICLLPSVYRGAESWDTGQIGASPLGVFRKYVDELLNEISRCVASD